MIKEHLDAEVGGHCLLVSALVAISFSNHALCHRRRFGGRTFRVVDHPLEDDSGFIQPSQGQ